MKKYKVTKKTSLREGGPLYNNVPGNKGYLGNMIYPLYKPNEWSEKPQTSQQTLGPVPKDESNLEAEKGETAYIPDVGGLAAHYKIGGNKHYNGGTPLNLPKDSFIFSDTAKMKIKDPKMLAQFGKTIKNPGAGITPADLAKQYDINKYRLVLNDPNSDDIQRKTAELMIGNYNIKLGKLALVQESKKGFPDGVPVIALPYLAVTGIDPKDVLPLRHPGEVNETPQQESSEGPHDEAAEQAMGKYGMQVSKLMESGGPLHAGSQDWANFGTASMQDGGSNYTGPTYQDTQETPEQNRIRHLLPDPKELRGIYEAGLAEKAKHIAQAPEKALTYLFSGKYQMPSAALGEEDPTAKYMTDLLLDPMLYADPTSIKYMGKAAKLIGSHTILAARLAGEYGKIAAQLTLKYGKIAAEKTIDAIKKIPPNVAYNVASKGLTALGHFPDQSPVTEISHPSPDTKRLIKSIVKPIIKSIPKPVSNIDKRQLPQSGIVVDKRTGEQYTFPENAPGFKTDVLTGQNQEGTSNMGDVSDIRGKGQKVTPTGYYTLDKYNPNDLVPSETRQYGKNLRSLSPIPAYGQSAPQAENLAMHQTYNPAYRNQFYGTDQSNQTYGCIDGKCPDIEKVFGSIPNKDTVLVLDSKNKSDQVLLNQAKQRMSKFSNSNAPTQQVSQKSDAVHEVEMSDEDAKAMGLK